MKESKYILLVFWLTVISLTGQLTMSGRSPVAGTGIPWSHGFGLTKPPVPGETIRLFSDRSVYGVGEGIHFAASYRPPTGFGERGWSTVLYVELVQWDGASLSQTKTCIEDNLASGILEIPPGIPSGYYYLKAYTRWMRNYSPGEYRYLAVKVVNPRDKAVVRGPENPGVAGVAGQPVESESTGAIKISGLREHYGRREAVEFQLGLTDPFQKGTYCISVAKTASACSDFTKGFRAAGTGEPVSNGVEYLPEISGHSLSGQVLGEDGSPVPDTRVQLSTYATPLLYSEVVTGNDGTFLFNLPRGHTSPELHIAETSGSGQEHRVLLSTEYCNRPLTLPYIPFRLEERETRVVREIILNAQLRERFAGAAGPMPATAGHEQPFYGGNAQVIRLGDFIELRDIRECIREIIPGVSVRTRDGKSGLVVHGPNCQEFYPPLVLMDNIPVPNDDRLLNIPGNRIERIEVVGSGYMVGNFRYSGIFSIFSRERDMAGISLEGDHHFFNYGLIQERDGPCMACQATTGGKTLPDIRNLLLWEPAVRMDPAFPLKISFITSDAGGEYVVSVRRLEPAGPSGCAGQAVFYVE